MAIIVGIDEAGYGPLLGPLVVAGVAFRVPDDDIDRCLWERLDGCVSRGTGGARERRLPIADSKKLYQRKAGLKLLERTALVMSAAGGHESSTFRQFLAAVSPVTPDELDAHPWYSGFDPVLPTNGDPRDVAVRSNAVRRGMAAADIRFLGAFVEPLLEHAYNRIVTTTRNKAVVSLGLVLRIIDRVAAIAGDEHLRVVVDRQGGRQHYGQALMTAFTGRELRIVEESDERSAYRLLERARPMDVSFTTGGEDRHMPIALASVFAKYIRELFMDGFNRYWCTRVESLKPTAGYYEDALRFLADIEPVLGRDGITRESLVRVR